MTFSRLNILILAFALLLPAEALALTRVPPGNRNATQPAIPYGSIKRTRRGKGTFEKKYLKIRNMLQRNKKLVAKIKKSAAAYGIDPVHIVGALVGEHTYNVDALDRYQTYYVKAMAYLNQDLSFRFRKIPVTRFVQYQAFSRCSKYKSSYDLWSCRESVWNRHYRGKKVNGVAFPNDRFGRVFFQPLYAGQTFGLGQLNPLTALKVNDIVHQKSRLPKLSADKPQQVYKTIMDPDSTLIYMAAVLKNSIDVYKRYAGFDISANPGVTATLYNLGNVKFRALQLAAKNKKRKAQGQKPLLPEENYYGWLVNDKINELRSLF